MRPLTSPTSTIRTWRPDRVDGFGKIERDAKVLGEVVQCAGGQNAQGGTGFNRNGRNRS